LTAFCTSLKRGARRTRERERSEITKALEERGGQREVQGRKQPEGKEDREGERGKGRERERVCVCVGAGEGRERPRGKRRGMSLAWEGGGNAGRQQGKQSEGEGGRVGGQMRS
jgi:hypothetical protein